MEPIIKIRKPKPFQVIILVLSLNLLVVSELFNYNLYNTNGSAFIIDYSISQNKHNNFIDHFDIIPEFQSNLLQWGEIISQYFFSGLESILSYQDESLVKVREDNKIECIISVESIDFTPQQIRIFSNYGIEASLKSNIIYIPLMFNGISIISLLEELAKVPGIIYIEPNFYDELMYIPNDTYYAGYQYDMRIIGMETAWNYHLFAQNLK